MLYLILMAAGILLLLAVFGWLFILGLIVVELGKLVMALLPAVRRN